MPHRHRLDGAGPALLWEQGEQLPGLAEAWLNEFGTNVFPASYSLVATDAASERFTSYESMDWLHERLIDEQTLTQWYEEGAMER